MILAFFLGKEVTLIAFKEELLLLNEVFRLRHHCDLSDYACSPKSEALRGNHVRLEPDDI